MKNCSIFILMVILFSCSEKNDNPDFSDFRDITSTLSVRDFEDIKTYILEKGDRQIYCNMYLDNPHYGFTGFDTYLNPETGQLNISCDPALSDFNHLVIQDFSSEMKYLHILLVRNNDLDDEKIVGTEQGMKERRVYLLNPYDDDLTEAETLLKDYLNIIHQEMQ